MEEWRTITECPVYQVSNLGRVKRIGAAKGSTVGLVLKPQKHPKTGYLYVGLHTPKKTLTRSVHGLVCRTFHGPPKPYQEVNHIDFNIENNTEENLEWTTRGENLSHSYRAGRKISPSTLLATRQRISVSQKKRFNNNPDIRPSGENNGASKLTDGEVRIIKYQLGQGCSGSILAARFGVSEACISNIRSGKRWSHIRAPESLEASPKGLTT